MNKNFRKFFAVVLAVAMLAAQMIVPAFAASAQEVHYCSECQDNGVLGEEVHRIDPTCAAGYVVYRCAAEDCNGTITKLLDPTDEHVSNGIVVPEVSPTCTEGGVKAFHRCAVCNKKLIPGTNDLMGLTTHLRPLGHDYQAVVTPENCTEDGYTTHTCTRCGDTKVDNIVAHPGHNYVLQAGQAATCKEAGWTEYYACSECGAEDPERAKVVLPVEDHGLHLEDTLAPTCLVDGYNFFKCTKVGCPYYDGITEVLPATGHEIVSVPAVNVTCENDGHGAYEYCADCDYTTDSDALIVPALGHNYVAIDLREATCTQTGLVNAIICDRCQFVHHAGNESPALGHNLETVDAVEAKCFEDGHTEPGNIEHKKCLTCEKLFAASVENDDIDAVPLTDVVTTTDHVYEQIQIAPTCTEQGYVVNTCEKCHHTYSDIVVPNGHNFELIPQVDPTCTENGVAAHNKCTVCEKLFAQNADQTDINAAQIVPALINPLGQAPVEVSLVKPTYDASGSEAGVKCDRCDVSLVDAEFIEELDEAVKFHYEISGVGGSEIAVNSGYVTLKVYFDVLADEDDKEAYASDVIANIFAVDFALSFNSDAFELTYVEVAPGAFTKAEFTPLALANEAGNVAISQDMVTAAKAFRGENNLFATLTFQVANDAANVDEYVFENTLLDVIHPEGEVIATETSETSAEILVKELGDANGDGIFTSHDTLTISQYIQAAGLDTEYVAEYDMNKDGVIDFIDLDLLRKAIVGNNEYLGIEVDPNAVVTPEV